MTNLRTQLGLLMIAVAISLFSAGNAMGADLIQSSTNKTDKWHGLYGGLTLGNVNSASAVDRNGGKDPELKSHKTQIGGILGYNFARTNLNESRGWMFGVELDASGAGGNDKEVDTKFGTIHLDSDWLISTRLRAGYAWENFYLYGTAGLAFSDIAIGLDKTKLDEEVRVGLALGAGAEFKLSEDWSARAEAIVYGFGEEKLRQGSDVEDAALAIGTARIGVTRRF